MTFLNRRTTLGDRKSEGARQLRLYMTRNNLSMNALARVIGCRSGTVDRWLWCKTSPGMHWAGRIERATAIPIALWAEPPRSAIKVAAASVHA